jgi:hypothetical protein
MNTLSWDYTGSLISSESKELTSLSTFDFLTFEEAEGEGLEVELEMEEDFLPKNTLFIREFGVTH